MEGIEDETQLKEQIVVTGAEVHSLLPYFKQASAHIGAGWGGQLYLG